VPITDMSQQHLPFPPPPPPPPPQGSASPRAGTAPYFTQHQQRTRPGPAQPPSITTSFLRTQGVGPQSQLQTPASAVGSAPHSALSYTHTPSTPCVRTPSAAYPDAGHLLDPSRAYLQSPASPSMAQQPYNPRQWSGHGHGSHLAYSQHPSPLSRANVEVTGMEGKFVGLLVPDLSLVFGATVHAVKQLQVRCLRRILQLQCLLLHLHTHLRRPT
jgi:hypothetical protein